MFEAQRKMTSHPKFEVVEGVMMSMGFARKMARPKLACCPKESKDQSIPNQHAILMESGFLVLRKPLYLAL